MKGDVIEASGDVHFAFRGYDVLADSVIGNTRTQVFILRGNVVMLGEGQIVRGDEVAVNLKDRTFSAFDAQSQLAPSFVGGNLLSDLFVRGDQVSGMSRRVEGRESLLTTCPLDHPHFEFRSERSVVRPGKRAVLRDVSLIILDRKLFTIPYLAIPLEKYSDRYIPEVGQSRDEGYFIKTRFTTPLPGEDYFDTRVDYYTKLGAGLGGAYYYSTPNVFGNAKVFGITGRPRSQIGSNEHTQKLWGGRFTFTTDYQKNNYLTAPNATLLNNRLSYFLNSRQGGSFRVSAFRNENRSGAFRSENRSISVGDQRPWTRFLTTSFDVNYSSSISRATNNQSVNREQVDTRFRGTYLAPFGTADLEYYRIIPIRQQEAFFGSGSRTPVLTFKTDFGRLFGKKRPTNMPVNIEAAVGEYGERTLTRTRIGFEMNMNRTDGGGQSRHTLTTQARFRQTLYNDDTAQYLMNLGLFYRYSLGPDTSFNLRYNYLRPEGYTPLSFDSVGQFHVANADVSFRPIRSLLLSAQSGYDFLQEKFNRVSWQSMTFRSDWRPNDKVVLQGTSFYDTTNHVFATNRIDFGWLVSGGTINVGTRYDGTRHTWGGVDIYGNGLTWGRLKTSVLFSYNGYTKRPEARHVSFTYDLHCAEAILQILDNPTGFRPGTQVAFFIRIKALPFDTPFGIGNRGQAIGGSSYRL